MSTKIAVGTPVRLRHGGQAMTVSHVTETKGGVDALCEWHTADGVAVWRFYPAEALAVINEGETLCPTHGLPLSAQGCPIPECEIGPRVGR